MMYGPWHHAALFMSVLGLAGCLSVGSAPPADVVEDGVPEPDVIVESCEPSELLTLRCRPDGGAVEICLESGWTLATECASDEPCFASALEPEVTCVPTFNCEEVTLRFIQCELAGLPATETVTCQSAVLAHTEGTDHNAIIDCSGEPPCDDSALTPDEFFACLLTSCADELTECYVEASEAGDAHCLDLYACDNGCGEQCALQCPEAGDAPRAKVEQGTCLAKCKTDCRAACRRTGAVSAQEAHVSLNLCIAGRCAGAQDEALASCVVAHCLEHYTACMATLADGDVGCLDTVDCLKGCAGQDSCTNACCESSSPETIDAALDYTFCQLVAASEGGVCEGKGGLRMSGCLDEACASERQVCE